eukprot:CAMPEP_0197035630 /NCGR_PEP_ID=MMETSP1384-20130603/13369_1 /TAXON_ID=29189 /ORGANISM="Ammonia sp." /LENGTH=445 /DNA_ID=CAMNT_0042465715 /DNA_START=133 /DNA_END=1470 /DNA_ORIENTATION=+
MNTLPQIPVNYASTSQPVQNYITHHINASPRNSNSTASRPPQGQPPAPQPSGGSAREMPPNRAGSEQQAYSSWIPQYSATLGTGITDPAQQRSSYAGNCGANTHSTPNSYTAEFYGDDHQQSLGFGAMSVTSSIINQPQTLQAHSTIQSALHNLNSSQMGLNPSSLVASAPPLAMQHAMTSQNATRNNSSNAPPPPPSNERSNSSNKENVEQNTVSLNHMKSEDTKSIQTASTNTNTNLHNAAKTVENTGSSNFYLAPGSANHGGSYRQTLNPAIYNAYRMSTSTSSTRSAALSPIPTSTHRSTSKSPVVHVIAETIYRIPSSSSSRMAAFRKQDRFDKTALYKTELCTNWMLTGSCTYGNKCHFAHGVEDLKPRMRVENYKTQPCCDPAREGCRRCMYGRRCNYCHPGEAIRRPHPTPYYDKDYYHALQRDFGQDNQFPFGIYV